MIFFYRIHSVHKVWMCVSGLIPCFFNTYRNGASCYVTESGTAFTCSCLDDISGPNCGIGLSCTTFIYTFILFYLLKNLRSQLRPKNIQKNLLIFIFIHLFCLSFDLTIIGLGKNLEGQHLSIICPVNERVVKKSSSKKWFFWNAFDSWLKII